MITGEHVLDMRRLSVGVVGSDAAIVEDVDLFLLPGEILGLVGESGSGKTTTSLSLLGYTASGTEIRSGGLTISGREFRPDESMRSARGQFIAYVPQDPSRSLNPSFRIERSVDEMINAHRTSSPESRATRPLLTTVGLPSDDEFAHRYPHQLSGGQQQRVCIAKALASNPSVIILDEPTTGLDVVTQATILAELVRLRDEQDVSMVYVSHDLAVVAQIADRIAVMYAGRIVEQGPVDQVLRRPFHPYTRGLLAALPDPRQPRTLESMPGISAGVGDRGPGCSFAARCLQRSSKCHEELPPLASVGGDRLVRCFHWETTPRVNYAAATAVTGPDLSQTPALDVQGLSASYRSRAGDVVVARDVSFTIHRGGCVALVGESGSGKTTIARAIVGLHPIGDGHVRLNGQELTSLARHRTVSQRRQVQIVFQNPAAALNPRHRIRTSIERPAVLLRSLKGAALDREVDRLLECVRLPRTLADRYPAELSGGERQRVALARALAAGPDLILCDEITSSLDISVQAAVLDLLRDLRRDLGLSLLFITHDLGVVAAIADHVIVLDHGVICEQGATSALLRAPRHPYTVRLLDAAPSVVATLG